jgi:hypothetical protein
MTIPGSARLLGFGGLLPFAAAALVALSAEGALRAQALAALIAYGAVILSFLGGIRWGLAMAAPDQDALAARLAFSVVPSLAGWVALLLPAGPGLVLLALGFLAMLAADRHVAEAPGWYPRLRLPLSLGAAGALLLGLVA